MDATLVSIMEPRMIIIFRCIAAVVGLWFIGRPLIGLLGSGGRAQEQERYLTAIVIAVLGTMFLANAQLWIRPVLSMVGLA